MFDGSTLLITGGTGSFGTAVLDRFINTGVKEIRIFSRDEKKQYDLRQKYKNIKIKYYIGDIRSYDSIEQAMKGVDYVFSAAALKQVPSCEFHPLEAVMTNVIGTGNTIRAAIHHKVKRVVVLSTDKAVYPINAMGMTKALMEKVNIALSRNLLEGETILCNTRYGNVMGTRGSVIPLFVDQIMNGEEITITDPDMTRFMMSIEEAVDLVLYAFENGKQGDTFIVKTPAITISKLVEALFKIFDKKLPIKILGTRHGEKKHECLASKFELNRAEYVDYYIRIIADTRDLNYGKYFEKGEKVDNEDFTSDNTYQLSIEEMIQLLLTVKAVSDFL